MSGMFFIPIVVNLAHPFSCSGTWLATGFACGSPQYLTFAVISGVLILLFTPMVLLGACRPSHPVPCTAWARAGTGCATGRGASPPPTPCARAGFVAAGRNFSRSRCRGRDPVPRVPPLTRTLCLCFNRSGGVHV